MERLKERIILRFYVEDFEPTIRFYQHIGFAVDKDIIFVGGARWVVLVKSDNMGIQLHLHASDQPRPSGYVQPIRFELSHANLSTVVASLKHARTEFNQWETPWAEGIELRDPIGNFVTLSEWFKSRFD